MIRFFLYIVAGETIDETSRWYRVAIGESASERRVYSSLQFYAAGHGHFFQRWSREVDEFFSHLLQAYPDALPLAPITGSQLLQSFKEGVSPALPSHVLSNLINFKKQTSSSYLSACRRVGMRFAQAERRKKPKAQ